MLNRPGQPLALAESPDPVPGPGQLLLAVQACGVCRTDLHLLDGDLRAPRYPLIPGHQIVGRVAAAGPRTARFRPGARVGVPWPTSATASLFRTEFPTWRPPRCFAAA